MPSRRSRRRRVRRGGRGGGRASFPVPSTVVTTSYTGVINSLGTLVLTTTIPSGNRLIKISKMFYELASEKPGNIQLSIAGEDNDTVAMSPIIMTGSTLRRGVVKTPKSSGWRIASGTINLAWVHNLSDTGVRYNISVTLTHKEEYKAPAVFDVQSS